MSKRLIDYGQGQMGEQSENNAEKLKSFMEHNPDAISIVDLEGKTLQVNAAFEDFSVGRMMSSVACRFQLFLNS